MDTSNRLPRLALALAALAPAACETPESATSLHPEGPPMLQQVFMTEVSPTGRNETVLAFGDHPDVPDARVRAVTRGTPLKNSLRVVFDELLLGNYLEEVQCNAARTGVANCPEWSRVPEGATPDDIARCAAPDGLDTLCHGEFAVCLNPEGVPCGIMDAESADRPSDGAPDALRLIAGAVELRCGTINVGFDVATSFWQPSGNQLVPSGRTPENSLGPALILKPQGDNLPTSQTDCRLVFADSIVDKDHIRVCAPPNGDIAGDCTPGDLSAFAFATDVLKVTSTQPADMAQGVALTFGNNRPQISVLLNAAVDADSLRASVTLTENGVVRNDIKVVRSAMAADRNRIDIFLDANNDNMPDPLLAGATYVVTVQPEDTFGIGMPAPLTFTFTTTGA